MRQVSRLVGILIAQILLWSPAFAQVATTERSSAADPATIASAIVKQKQATTLPTGVSRDWYERSMEQIRKREYQIRPFDERSVYAAANYQQRLGFLFKPEGYVVKNILAESTAEQWEFNFLFNGISREGETATYQGLRSSIHEDNTLEYRYDNYTVQYVNDDQGMRQNFVVWNSVGKRGQGHVEVSVGLQGDLSPEMASANHLVLLDKDKNVRMMYDGIKAWDAKNKPLATTLELRNEHELIISVDDSKATYPITIDPLNHTPNWTDSGNGLVLSLLNDLSTPVLYGYSVSGAGDLNGDGFDDVIIGAPAYVNIINLGDGSFNPVAVGAAFVYFGSSSGLAAEPAEVLQPTSVVGALFGFSVSSAGDVNGDGRADIVIGAPGDKINLTVALSTVSVAVGKVYVYHGTQFDGNLNTQPTASASISLKQSDFVLLPTIPVNPLYGFSVASAGDVNGDGKSDIVVGAPAFTDLLSLNLAGRVDVYHGSATGIGSTPARTIKGGLLNGLFGYSVSAAGRVNNDTYGDIVVGAPASINLLAVGAAYVFHGSATGITATSAAAANTSLNAPGLLNKTLFGYSVSAAGDVNGDGRADVIIGEPLAIDLFSGSLVAVGKAHIFYGSNSGVTSSNRTQLTSPRKPGLLGLITGNLLFGFSVSGVSDVNCDGVDDVIVGEPGGTSISLGTGLLGLVSTNAVSGQAYIFYGKNTTGPVDAPGYTITHQGGTLSAANLLGHSVKGSGDVNGDGKPDFLVGAPNGTLNLGASLTSIIGNTLGYLTVNSIGSTYGYHGCINDIPVAADDAIITPEDTPVTFNIISNDIDADGLIIASSVDLDITTPGVQKTVTTAEGSWSVNAAGMLTFTPVLNYFGPASIQYRVADNMGASSNNATVTVTVTPVNDAPVANNDNAVTAEDVAVTINVTANDTDVDGTIDVTTVDLDPATAGIQNSISTEFGSWVVNASGVVTFTPAANFFGSTSITYVVNDNSGATSNTATISVNVSSVNDAPVAVNDNASTNEDVAVTFSVIANDTDVDGTIAANTVDLDPATAGRQTSFTSSGTWTVDNTGKVTYTPSLNFHGTASITYTVNDNSGATSNIATISVNVASVNDAPVANNDSPATPEDTPVTFSVTANDTDVDGTIDPPTVDLDPVTAGIQKTVTVASGTFSVDASGNVTYTPALNFNGTATIGYTVKDNDGLLSNVGTISVTVTSVNDAPVANNDNATTPEDVAVTVNVIANDTDVDGTINPASVDLDPATAGVQTTITNTFGTWTADATGKVTFTPAADFNGTASATYTVNDNGGATSNVATISVTVTSVNDAPVAVNDNASTNEDVAVTFSVVANDTDADGTIDATSVDLNPTTAGKQSSITTAAGSWSVDGTGKVTFTPAANYNGSASITYTVNDNNGTTSNVATITVSVSSVNDAPVAVNDNPSTSQNTPVTFSVTANDYDVDGTINAGTVDLDPTTAGIQTAASNASGNWAVDVNGNVTYTPAAGFTGNAVITYTVNDDGGTTSNVATITVNVQAVAPVNVAPVANNDNGTTDQGVAVTIHVTANDTDADGTINASTVDLVPGTAGIQNSTTTAAGSWSVSSTGIVTFTPIAAFSGNAVVTYVVNDNSGSTSNVATVTIAVNAAPVANNDNAVTNEDTQVTINVVANDTDADGTIDATSVDLDPATAGKQSSITTSKGIWTVSNAGVVTFVPAQDVNGPASITYTVKDNKGLISNVATISISITAVNDPPVAANDNATTAEDVAVTFSVVTNDTDVDGTINANSVDLNPASGGRQTSLATTTGVWSVDNTGKVTFTPTANFFGTASITYTVNDNTGATSNVATINVTVTSVNDAPVANNDSPATDEDTPITFSVVANDTDLDGTIDPATVDLDPATAGVQPTFTNASGTWTVDATGKVTYTPTANFNGTATIGYTVKDNDGLTSNIGTITVNVSPVNDAPVANNDTATTPEDVAVVINVVTNDTDVDGTINAATVDLDPLAAGIQNNLTNASGTWTADITGKVTFTPADNFNGTASASYVVNDNSGATSNVATITVTITAVNDAPVAVNDNASTSEDIAVTFNVTGNDTDADGTIDAASVDLDPATAGKQSSITTAAGSWTVNATGNVTFTPAANFNGTASVSYTVNDNSGLTSNIATISVTVDSVNDAPVAVNDHITTNADVAVTLLITSNDTDIDGTIDPATVDLDPTSSALESTFTNAQGSWTVTAAGLVTFTPAQGFFGSASIGYTVKDNDGLLSNVATISIDVIWVNTPPVAVDDHTTTIIGNPVTIKVTMNDWDIDGTIDPSTGCLVTAGGEVNRFLFAHNDGTWTLDLQGNVTFSPAPAFVGVATLPYTVADNNGLMSNQALITVTVVPAPQISAGLAKSVTPAILQADGSSKMTFTFTLENFGQVGINDIKVEDDLSAAFPAPATFTVVEGTASGTLRYNENFNGSTDINLLLPTSVLGYAATETITLTILVNPNGAPGRYSNSATLTAKSDDGTDTSTDTSDEGTDPDQNGNGDPTDAGENDPTIVDVIANPVLVVTKEMTGDPVKNNDCTYTVTFAIKLQNTGNEDLRNIALIDNLDLGIPAPTTYRVTSVTSSELSINAGYDGKSDKNLLMNGNDLMVGETAEIIYTVIITPNEHYGPFFNIVEAKAEDGAGMTIHYTSAPINFEIIPTEVFIPEGFSPNGDGIHDSFEITLSCGLTAKLTVFNRWGDKVYGSDNYQNEWTGTSNHGAFLGKLLPEGTYFYNCELSSGTKVTSFLTIKH